MNRHIAGMLATCLLCTGAAAEEHLFIDNDPSKCMEGPMAQFGRYVGDWKITDESMKRDGSGWEPGEIKRWIFKCIGNGTAVQDFWLPPNGGFGTNLRTYNPDTGKWDIVWAATNVNGFTHISATQNDEGNVVMDIVSPVQDPPRRIIFFAPEGDGWNWAMQWSQDEGKTWFDVYRISASPWTDDARPVAPGSISPRS